LTVGRDAAQAGGMNGDGTNNRRLKLTLLAGAGLVALVVAWWVWRTQGGELRPLVDQVLGRLRAMGAVTFFVLMALLPAAGCPLTVFTLTAGPVFGPTLGMPLVLVLVWVSIAFNLALSYWLARYALRPWLARLLGWLGYKLPEVAEADHRGLVILVRVTPGPPYVLQSYLLGLAGIPFATYFFISWVISSSYACAFVLFGDALMQGRGRTALLAVMLFIALTVAVQFLRRHYRKPPAQP
jgi:uncharacterized membrane protein YdjX (TVP38/TMEM64 family)